MQESPPPETYLLPETLSGTLQPRISIRLSRDKLPGSLGYIAAQPPFYCMGLWHNIDWQSCSVGYFKTWRKTLLEIHPCPPLCRASMSSGATVMRHTTASTNPLDLHSKPNWHFQQENGLAGLSPHSKNTSSLFHKPPVEFTSRTTHHTAILDGS